MIVISRNLVLSPAEQLNADNPVIGWHDLVETTNITATTEDADFPVTNLANPATHLKWVGGDNDGDEYLTVTTNYLEPIDYLAVARHNFGSANIVTSVDGATVFEEFNRVLLHFDRPDGSTDIIDDNAGGSPHVWTANGNAQVSTVTSVFGGSSLFCDGVGDHVSMPDHADIALGSGPFTVDTWIGPNGGAGTHMNLGGQCDSTASNASTSFFISRTASNVVLARACVGATAFDVTSTTPITSGFHHVRFVRVVTGLIDVLRLFIDGVQEGGDVAITGAINNSSNALSVGRAGEVPSTTFSGWIDEFAIFVGEAKSTAAFPPPVVPFDDWIWFELVQEQMLADDAPALFRFEPQILGAVRLALQPGDDVPSAAVLFVGKLLVLERSIKIDVPHTPFPMGIVSKEINGKSESGNFLGRIEINRFNQSEAAFSHFQPAWYRTNFQPFVVARQPFFFAWNPTEYPTEVGYAWLMDNPMPEVDTVTRRVAITMKMQGIVN